MGKLVKLLTFSLSCLFLLGCAPVEEEPEPVIELEENQIAIHGRWAGRNKDASVKIITLNVGDPIVGILQDPIEGYWGSPSRPVGVYLDAKRTTKLKASQLLNWDGSFHHIYMYSDLTDDINISEFYSGTYYGNEEDRYINFSNGSFTMNFDGSVITGDIVLGEHSLYFNMVNVVFNGIPATEFVDYDPYNLFNYMPEAFQIQDQLGLSTTGYESKSIVCDELLPFFNLVALSGNPREYNYSLIFTQNNNFSIDYDL